jgi:hypothetical protein
MRADALRRDPDDPDLRIRLIRGYMSIGEHDRAHALLTLDITGDNPELIVLLARLEFRIGRFDEGRRVLEHLMRVRHDRAEDMVALGRELAEAGQHDAAFACADLASDRALAEGDWDGALSSVQEFVRRVPYHVPALLKLIEMCVDRGVTETMTATQRQLADAYLHAGRAAEARVIAEDLVMRAPWERASVERLLRALVLCHDPEPEETIANLLCADGSVAAEDL